jgi:hypothetical protein
MKRFNYMEKEMPSNNYPIVDYGFTQALNTIFPSPIVALRNPTTADKGALGQIWVNKSSGSAFILVAISNNSYTWTGFNSSGSFSSLTVTPGPISLTGNTDINTSGSGIVNINTGTATGAVNIATGASSGNVSIGSTTGGSTIIAGSDMTLVVAASGTLSLGTTGAIVQIVEIATGAAANQVTIGSTTGAASTTIQAGSGNINLDGVLALSATGPQVLFGAGDPTASVPKGSLYIKTDAALATDRLWIATDSAGTWASFTASA